MRRRYVLGVMFFGGVWGLSEALLGGWFYAAGFMRLSSVVLAAVAFMILTAARASMPMAGASLAIGATAVLYKLLFMGMLHQFFSNPIYYCHLAGIFCLAVGFELVFGLARGRWKPVIGLAGSYVGFALFAVTITYVFRYSHWTAGGLEKILRYIFITGSAAAACNAVLVPLTDMLARRAMLQSDGRAALRTWAARTALAATVALWGLAVGYCFIIHGHPA